MCCVVKVEVGSQQALFFLFPLGVLAIRMYLSSGYIEDTPRIRLLGPASGAGQRVLPKYTVSQLLQLKIFNRPHCHIFSRFFPEPCEYLRPIAYYLGDHN